MWQATNSRRGIVRPFFASWLLEAINPRLISDFCLKTAYKAAETPRFEASPKTWRMIYSICFLNLGILLGMTNLSGNLLTQFVKCFAKLSGNFSSHASFNSQSSVYNSLPMSVRGNKIPRGSNIEAMKPRSSLFVWAIISFGFEIFTPMASSYFFLSMSSRFPSYCFANVSSISVGWAFFIL